MSLGTRRAIVVGTVLGAVLVLVLVFVVAKRKRAGWLKAAEDTMAVAKMLECGEGDDAACREVDAANHARCDKGDSQGCVLLGIGAQQGTHVPKDPEAALGYFRRACDLRDANGCWYLGLTHEQGQGISKNEAKAVEAYQRGCDIGGDVNVCDSLGGAYQYGRGGPVDKRRALSIYERGCTFGKRGAVGFVCDHAARLRAELGAARAP